MLVGGRRIQDDNVRNSQRRQPVGDFRPRPAERDDAAGVRQAEQRGGSHESIVIICGADRR